MIIGIGFDLEDIAGFERTLSQSGEAFLKRVYTEQEVAYCRSQPHSTQSYAVRFAAKEAAMKALGIAGKRGLKWRDVEILATAGPPKLLLTGVAATTARRLKVERLLVSLSHSRSTAGAVVVAESSRSGSDSTRALPKDSISMKIRSHPSGKAKS